MTASGEYISVYARCTSLNSTMPTKTPAPMPTMNFMMNGTICSMNSSSAVLFTFCIRSRTMNGRMTFNGVLKMLSSLSSVSTLDFPFSSSMISGDVPVIMAANNKLLQNGMLSMYCAATVNRTSVNMVKIIANFAAFQLKVSSSRKRSLAVLSNTIIANAKIATLERKTVGN